MFVNGIAVVSGLRGSFSSVDGPFDPKRHKLAVTSYTYGDFQDCLKGAVPENTVKGGTPSLTRAMRFGNLGEQVVLKSEKAFSALKFTGFEVVPWATYHVKRRNRDEAARADFRKETEAPSADGVFMVDILRNKMERGDARLR